MLRHTLRQAIPSMFHRRLMLLGVIVVVVILALGLRAWQMAVGRMHEVRKQQVESSLVRTRYAPTRRGKILDRNGMVLAEDRPGWNIAVNYSVLSGAWVKQAAARAARGDAAWAEASDAERDQLVARCQTECATRLANFWRELAKVAKVEPQMLFDKQDELVRKTATLHAKLLQSQWLKRVGENHWKEDSPEARKVWEELQKSFWLKDERIPHVILEDVPPEVRLAVQDIIDQPEEVLDGSALPGEGPKTPPSLWQKLGLVPTEHVQARRLMPDSPWQQVELQMVRARRYPQETAKILFDRSTLPGDLQNAKPLALTVKGVGMHVLGYTRPAREADWAKAPFYYAREDGLRATDLHGVLPDDEVGAMGVEAQFEDSLRGSRGEMRMRRIASDLAGKDRRVEPVPGRDVQLSIDIKVQARVEAALSREIGLTAIDESLQPWNDSSYFPGKTLPDGRVTFKPNPAYTYADLGKGQLNGAAVVLDAATGEVLAAASAPGISLEDIQNKLGELWADEVNAPMADRVAQSPKLPGSIMKPLVLTAAITEGVYQPGEIVDIPGYPWVKDKHSYRDFYYVHTGRPLGKHSLDFALAVSSSPPFVMLAQTREDRSGKERLGPNRTLDWYDRFGFGHAPNAGVPASRGRLGFLGKPTPEKDACLVAMGQGDAILATPLQVAVAYCRFLNGHFNIDASFLKRPPDWRAQVPAGAKRIAPEAVAFTLKGMWMATHYTAGNPIQGTFVRAGSYPDVFNCPGVEVWGKSGTAQTWPQRVDSNKDKKLNGKDAIVRAGDHAWAVALCAPKGDPHPRFVIIATLEYGGSGGRAAGPIANQVVHALKAEGYLEKEPKAAPAPVVVNPVLQKSIDELRAAEPAAAEGDASDAAERMGGSL